MDHRPEIKALTSFRGIAAILVVLYHFRQQFGMALALDRYTHIFQASWLWVDFFFILSGFVIAYRYGPMFREHVSVSDYTDFVVRRLSRVYPLHLFMLLCFIPTEFAKYLTVSNADPAFSKNTPASILTNLLLIHSWHLHPRPTWDNPSWSISAEFAAYLLFPLLGLVLMRLRAATLGFVGLVCLGLLALLKATIGGGTLDVTADWGVLRCLPSFSIGIVLCQWHSTLSGRVKRFVGSDIMLTMTWVGVLVMLHRGADEILIITGFCLLVFSGSLNVGLVGRFLSAPPFYMLGVLSYSIYLTHGLILRIWQFTFERLFHSEISTPVAIMALVVLLATIIVTSALTYRYLEVPGRHFVRAIAARWRSRAPIVTA